MPSRPNFQAGGKELDRVPYYVAHPSLGLPNLSIVPREGVAAQKVKSQGITPIGRFAVVLLLFALAVFFLPVGIRGWFVIIILLGALTVNEGAIQEFKSWALGG